MADLLECLIQIKGLADTPRRLAMRAAGFAAAAPSTGEGTAGARDTACALLSAEARFRRALDAMLAQEHPALERLPGDPGGGPERSAAAGPRESFEACERAFSVARADTIRILEACTAEQLNRIGLDPSRGPMTVADLVAVMLAHDTDRLGDLIVR